MPEVRFRVRWPDQSACLCYSPSSTIRDYFRAGEAMPMAEFVTRSRTALEHGSARVRDKYGFGCGHAAQQIRQIEEQATRFAGLADAQVTVEAFEE